MEDNIFDKIYTKLQTLHESKTNKSNFNFVRLIRKYLKSNTKISLAHNLIILDQLESRASHLWNECVSEHIDNKFKYMKLIKYFLNEIQTKKYKKKFKKNYKEYLIFNLNVLMIYSVNKSFKQYKIFQLNYDDHQILNSEMFNDEISIIELMNEFRANLIELIKIFRSIFYQYSLIRSPKNFPFYEYITWLLRVYFDTTLEIKNKIDHLENSKYINSCKINSISCKILIRLESLFHKSKISKLFNSLLFDYIDNITFYVLDLLLQMESVNEKNVTVIIPCLEKLISIDSNSSKVSKSKYLRLILVYSKINLLSSAKNIPKFEFLKKFILDLKVSSKFEKFYINLIYKYSHSTNLCKLKIESKNNSLDPNEKLRNCLLFNIDRDQNNEIFFTLHSRSFRKFEEIFSLIIFEFELSKNSNDISSISLSFTNLSQTKTPTQIVNQESNQKIVNNHSKNSIDDNIIESDIEKDEASKENELIFTSDYSVFDYESNGNSDDELFKPKKLDQERLKQVSKTITIESSTEKQKNPEESAFSLFLNTRQKNVSLNLKKNFDRSPSPSNISRLNLFKKVFDDDKQSNLFNSLNKEKETVNAVKESESNNFKSVINPVNRFYKLNDLVSVMLNEDYFKKI